MGWICLWAVIGGAAGAMLFANPEKVANYDGLFAWYFGTLSSVLLGTLGLKGFAYNAYTKSPLAAVDQDTVTKDKDGTENCAKKGKNDE
jgi:hypothetical protein